MNHLRLLCDRSGWTIAERPSFFQRRSERTRGECAVNVAHLDTIANLAQTVGSSLDA